ncbi:hypothetical protein BU17DRAFT_95480 [Hysterangium stoloniferum]|nr:hypothetical protein BU17DRAFT_95480 [Hysterangium stoloniferum]
MPILHLKRQHLSLEVEWKGKKYRVVRVLQQRPISIVLLVEWAHDPYRVIKLYPKRDERHLYKGGFEAESKAYRILRDARCKVVPRYHGSCHSAKLVYPPETTILPEDRLCGGHPAIMLQYLDGKLVIPDNNNFTLLVAQKALEALDDIHKLGICHGDINDNWLIRNLMFLKNEEVAWFDFEHSQISDKQDALSFEQELAEELMGTNSYLYKAAKTKQEQNAKPFSFDRWKIALPCVVAIFFTTLRSVIPISLTIVLNIVQDIYPGWLLSN